MATVGVQFILLCAIFVLGSGDNAYWDYIVVGAGPGGLQLGYYMQQANRNYIIFERANVSGSFFQTYPRHGKLISINKRNTGKTNSEFNMRHDWNSLLSDDSSLLFTKYSKKFFPPKDDLVKYLNDYQKLFNINVQHNTDIRNIQKTKGKDDDDLFTMEDQHGNTYSCKTLIMATGLWKPNVVKFDGAQYTEGYETMNIDPESYEGQTVLILGRGNAAFEVADSIYGNTNLIHMIARSRIRLSWATHYVGDLRAVNNGILDTYQLKSLDGVLEAPMEDARITKKKGKLYVELQRENRGEESELYDNFALREGYDRVIRCLGFTFDVSPFNETIDPARSTGRSKKYLKLKDNYESENIPGLFVAGTASHYVDFRKSSGGFIHGFRYTARTLHRLLEWRNHKKAWKTEKGPITQLLTKFVKRINEVSGLYQMFGVLVDVVILNQQGTEYEYLEEVPVKLLHELPSITGIKVDRLIVVSMEYGANFSGAGKDTFRLDRAVGEPAEAFKSNFLHPVFYYYKHLPTVADMEAKGKDRLLPVPDRVHHTVEDFLTSWTASKSHILPLRRFIETVINNDLRNYFAESCFLKALMRQDPPLSCTDGFANGFGLSGNDDLHDAAIKEVAGIVPTLDI